MLLWIYRLLSLAAAAGSLIAGHAVWQALLLGLGVYAGLNLLFVLFWVCVAQTVDTSKPIEEQKKLYRLGIASVATWLCEWAHVHTEIHGEELLPQEGRFLLVCNHRSGFDPIVKASVLRDYNIAFISKPSNINLPFIGPLAFGDGYLPINRENDREALKTILQAADYLKRDLCSMAVYPEGTRSKTPEMLPFHAGSFKIAQRGGVPVVIAAISGTEQIRKNFPFRPTHVRLDILEVIPAAEVKGMSTQALAARSRERMEAALATGAEEAKA